jgi:hypothetical protein
MNLLNCKKEKNGGVQNEKEVLYKAKTTHT